MAEQARREVVNGDQPARVPVMRMGNVAVIVHVVWSDGAGEWRPARAIRWTSMHVMVGWREDTGGRPGTHGMAACPGRDAVGELVGRADPPVRPGSGGGTRPVALRWSWRGRRR